MYLLAHTRAMAKIVPVREFRANLSELLDRVSVHRDQAVEAGLGEVERGETVTLAELRRELAERRSAR